MRILSKCQLKELILYSLQHVVRLEKAGKFRDALTTRKSIAALENDVPLMLDMADKLKSCMLG